MNNWNFKKRQNLKVILAAASVFLAIPIMAADQVPFKMTLNLVTTSIAPNPDTCGSGLLVKIVGSGNATELGRFTDTQQHCIYPPDSPVFDKGQFVFTAANGDLLVGGYSGFLVPT